MVKKSFFILRKAAFQYAKGHLWACKRTPFTMQLMPFLNKAKYVFT